MDKQSTRVGADAGVADYKRDAKYQLQTVLQTLRKVEPSRTVALAITKTEEALHWLAAE